MPITADQGDAVHPSRSIAARAGRWSARHRKIAIIGWLAFVVIATFAGRAVGQRDVPDAQMGNGESRRGDMMVDAAGFPERSQEQVLIEGADAGDRRVADAVAEVVAGLRRTAGVRDIRSPLRASDRASTVSKNGRSVVVS